MFPYTDHRRGYCIDSSDLSKADKTGLPHTMCLKKSINIQKVHFDASIYTRFSNVSGMITKP